MHPEIRQFIEQSEYCQGALRELATMLPGSDTELDELIGETVTASDQRGFVFVVMAALLTDRPVQARH
jgi:hypothetical protein